jgi:hypothetical protein
MRKTGIWAGVITLFGLYPATAAELPGIKTADLLAVVDASKGPPRDLFPLVRQLTLRGTNEADILAFEDTPFFACMVGRFAGWWRTSWLRRVWARLI